jgi:hypothetical protein
MPAKRGRRQKATKAKSTKTIKTTTVVKSKPRYYKRKQNPETSIFPLTKNVSFVYRHVSGPIASNGVSNSNMLSWRLNSLYDPDYNNNLGNKGPLFKDVLLGANGPYRNYRVNAWKLKLTVLNHTEKPIMVYLDPASYDISEADSTTEMLSRRGVIRKLITAQSNANPSASLKSYMTLKKFAPRVIATSENYSAAYNANPSSVIYANLVWAPIDGSTTTFTISVQVDFIVYATLYNADSTASV